MVKVKGAPTVSFARQRFAQLFTAYLKSGVGRKTEHGKGKGWKDAEFGDKIGKTPQAVGTWRRGQALPRAETFAQILDIFSRDMHDPQRLEVENAWKAADKEHESFNSEVNEHEPNNETRDLHNDIQLFSALPPYRSENIDLTTSVISNLGIKGISRPRVFLGRENIINETLAILLRPTSKGSIVTLYGLPGVGKTALAAAYAEQYKDQYRVIWWISAQTITTICADLVSLGISLGWVHATQQQEYAIEMTLERLQVDSKGFLLVYDNAITSESLKPYLPLGLAHIVITSTSHVWRDVAEPLEIVTWQKQTGADFLIARTGFDTQRDDAEKLSERLGGLPLALEQAAAYCEKTSVSFADYRRRFNNKPVKLLDDERNAPSCYYNKRTVAKTLGTVNKGLGIA